MRNHEPSINSVFHYEVRNEFVEGLLVPELIGEVTVTGIVLKQFKWVWLVADGADLLKPWLADNPQIVVTNASVIPSFPVKRVIGAWGTVHDTAVLMRQVQTDRVVQFHGDLPFDPDLAVSGGFGTGGQWIERGHNGAFPPSLCAAVYFRLEARRVSNLDSAGLGFAQINVSSRGNGPGQGTMAFNAQVKALTRNDQPEAYGDMVRCIIDPGANKYSIFVNQDSKGFIGFSGYELLPT